MKSVRSVARAIDILQCFSGDKPSMSVLEIEKKIRLNRPTLYRLLETLASRGLIRAHGAPQRFSLDYGVARLAQTWLSGLDPVAAAQPILERLREETAETVGLTMLRDRELLYILELRSPQALAMVRGIGATGQLGRGASGKVTLAFLDEKTRASLVQKLPKEIDKNRLRHELAEARRDRFNVSRGEILAGAVAIGAPYFDHQHRVAGAVAVYGPEVRFGKDRIAVVIKLVAAAAARLSTALGGEVSGEPT